MKKIDLIVALITIFFLGITSFAQSTGRTPLDELSSLVPVECQRTVESIPAIRGVRLGMRKDEVLKLVKPLSARLIAVTSRINRSDFADPENGRDLISLEYELFDDRVISISIVYLSWAWDDPRDAVKPFSDQLGLNAKCWDSRDLGLTSVYAGKDIVASIGYKRLKLTDVAATAAKDTAERKAAEDRKKTFKF